MISEPRFLSESNRLVFFISFFFLFIAMSAAVQRIIFDKLVSSVKAISQVPTEPEALATWGKTFCRDLVRFRFVIVVKMINNF